MCVCVCVCVCVFVCVCIGACEIERENVRKGESRLMTCYSVLYHLHVFPFPQNMSMLTTELEKYTKKERTAEEDTSASSGTSQEKHA